MATNMTLITDGASHYCEKARWALERAGASFTETKHVVLLHMLFTRGLGAGTSCPKLVTGRSSERVVLQESPDILRFADKNIRNEEDRLYPEDPELQKLVQAWEGLDGVVWVKVKGILNTEPENIMHRRAFLSLTGLWKVPPEWRFDKQLGPHVRRWSYCYLLFDPCSYMLLTQGAPVLERIFAWILMPLLRRIVYSALYCNKSGAQERSLQVVEAIFKEVDDLLADGRPYICGRRFTAADVSFAALGGPMVAPSQYGAWLPAIEECPTDMAKTMQYLRKSAAGKHILKIYETKRHQSQETGTRAVCRVG